MHIVVIIPILNERESLTELYARLRKSLEHEQSFQFTFLFVDSGSVDGSQDFVRELNGNDSRVMLLEDRVRTGLGGAYSCGMQHAINSLHADFVLEIDGDLQHRPEDIPTVLQKTQEGYDYIIGSRFIEGGSIPASWGLERKVLSVGGNLLARGVLGLWTLHDVTSGFKLSRVKGFLDQVDFSRLYSTRHAYKIHLLYYMVQLQARIAEVPITFEERSKGKSKLISNDILDSLRVLSLLRIYGA